MIKSRYRVSACGYHNGTDVFVKNQSIQLEQKLEANYNRISLQTVIADFSLLSITFRLVNLSARKSA
jgi:hypothetical protein